MQHEPVAQIELPSHLLISRATAADVAQNGEVPQTYVAEVALPTTAKVKHLTPPVQFLLAEQVAQVTVMLTL